MKIMLKKIIVDYSACVPLEKCFTFEKIKENKPKIVQNTMTNSCPQSHDD